MPFLKPEYVQAGRKINGLTAACSGPQDVSPLRLPPEPTLYGRALLKRSVAVFNDLRTSVTELSSLSDPTAGELRIGSTEAAAARLPGGFINYSHSQQPTLICGV